MRGTLRGVAALAALLMLAGCGATKASTPTAESKEPVDEVAEFGEHLATLLNQGKSSELFDLWSDKGTEKRADLRKALMPDAKAKGIKWEYDRNFIDDDGGQEVALRWKTSNQSYKENYVIKKEKGEWRLKTTPFDFLSVCSPFSVDGAEAPVVSKARCTTREGGLTVRDGQTLLILPGTHSLSVDVFKGVFDQPYQVTTTPDGLTFDYDMADPTFGEGNLAPENAKPAAGYVDTVKAAFAEEAADAAKDSDGHPDLFDGITVTPTDDLSRPEISGTYRHWVDGAYQDRDISELSYSTILNWNGFVVLF